jgi:hypothetical protein
MRRFRIGGLPIWVYTVGFAFLVRLSWAFLIPPAPGQPGPNFGALAGIAGGALVICAGVWYFFLRPTPEDPMKEIMNDPWVRANADKLGAKFFDDTVDSRAAPHTESAGKTETGIAAMDDKPTNHATKRL